MKHHYLILKLARQFSVLILLVFFSTISQSWDLIGKNPKIPDGKKTNQTLVRPVYNLPAFVPPVFAGLPDFCSDEGVQTGLGGGSPTGGVYSGLGVTDNGNGTTFSFNPSVAGAGVHTITYTLLGESSCAQVTVHAAPDPLAGATIDACLVGSTEIAPTPGTGCTSQEVLFIESFETDGEGTRYDATLNTLTGTPEAYFGRARDIDINVDYNGEVGPYYWTGEDHDHEDVGRTDPSLQIDFWVPALDSYTADIVGRTNVVFKGLFAANPNSPFSNTGSGAAVGEADAYIRVDYTINGGLWIPALQFSPSAGGTGLSLDTDFDGVGDCDLLTRDFKEFTFPIPSGPDFRLRVFIQSDETGEEWAIDNFGIYADGPADCQFNFYNADPGAGPATLLAGPTSAYDPGTTSANSPQSIWVTQVSAYGCESEAAEYIVEVSEETVTLNLPPLDLCITDDPVTGLTGGSPAGGVYSGTGVTDNGGSFTFDPAAAGPSGGTITVTYTVAGSCSEAATDDIVVNELCCPLPVAACVTGPLSIILDGDGLGSLTVPEVDNGSTAGCGLQSLILSQTSFTCSDVGVLNVTLTITDINGDSDDCTTLVEIQDLQAPTITCPEDVSFNNQANLCEFGIDVPVPDVEDNCTVVLEARYRMVDENGVGIGPWSFYANNPSGTYAVGRWEMEWRASDPGGNSITCSFYMEVVDAQNPTISCAAINGTRIADFGSCEFAMFGSGFDPTFGDNCPGASISNDYNDSSSLFGTTFPVGSTPVIWTVTDASGNTATCSFTVDVTDAEAPTAVCQNVTVQLDAAGTGSTTAAAANNGSFDACGIASLSLSQTTFGCAEVGANTETLTVTDVNGNASTCSATVTVEDNVAPTALCQDVTVQLDVSGTASISASDINNGSSDVCGIQSLAVNPQAFNCADVGPNTVTLTVTDVNSNVSTCTATVTVADDDNPCCAAPQAVCQNITVLLDNNGTASITADDVDDGSTASCGLQSLDIDISTFNCSNTAAPVTVTLTVTDIFSAQSTCTATVTVKDELAPTAVCQDVTVQLNAAGTATLSASAVNNGSTDNCGVGTLGLDINSFDCDDVPSGPGITDLFISEYVEGSSNSKCIEIYNGTGAAVNLSSYQLLFYFNGSTTVGTTISLSGTLADGDVYVVCDNDAASGFVAVADLLPTSSFFNGDDAIALVKSGNPIDIIGRIGEDPGTEWTGGGNSTLDRTLVRNASVMSGNTANTVGFPSLATEWTGFANNTSSQLGSHTVNTEDIVTTLTVTDVNGNTSTCTANVTVQDNVDPTAVCQDVTVQLNAAGTGSTTAAAADNGSSDACGIESISLSQTTFGCAEVGPNAETLTVTDVNGNSATCSVTVTVEDNVAPNSVCQDVTVQLNAAGTGSTTAAAANNGSSDACGIESLSLSQTTFGCAEVGPNAETLTVTDVNGNSSTCSVTVTVEDNVDPNAVCQDVTVQLDINGTASISETDINNGSSDVCGIQSLSVSPQSFDCTDVGPNAVILTVTDVNGNISTCTATVTVADDDNPCCVTPEAICQDLTVLLDNTGNVSITADEVDNGSIATCGLESLDIDISTFNCSNVGTPVTVTLTVTDVLDGQSTCTATVTVQDNVDPTAVCQDVTVQLNAAGTGSTTAAAANNGSSDACGIESLSLSQTTFGCADVGPNAEILTVTDVNGNSSTCSVTVTVEDNVDPTAVCQDVTVQLNAAGTGSTTAVAANNGSSDACGIESLSLSQTTFGCAEVGPNAETLTVTDVNGNSSTCSVTVTVEDNVDPTALCQDVTVQLDINGTASISETDINNGSSDVCGIQSLSVSPQSFDCTDVGPNAVILTVTDVNGNISTCTATVTVADDDNPCCVAPQAVCQNITVTLNSAGTASITVDEVDNGSTADCGLESLDIDISTFNCSNVGDPVTVTLTVTDILGGESTCTATVTVEDEIDPTAVCQDVTVQLGEDGTASLLPAAVDNGSSDNCNLEFTLDVDDFDCDDISSAAVISELFISEYVEGGSNNKCIEIFNGTGSPVNLSTYELLFYFNGSTTAGLTLSLTGTVADGDVYVVCNSGATADFLLQADLTSGSGFFNGDDAVVLTKSGNPIDIIGRIGEDPGTAWTGGGNSTLDRTLVRNANVLAGNTANAVGFPSLATEWTGFANNVSSQLGSHSVNSGGGIIVTLTATDPAGNAATCTATVTVLDNVAPEAICQDVTIQLDENGTVTLSTGDINDGSSDACGVDGLDIDETTFDCSEVGPNTVTLTVTDVNGNASTCSATVTVEDNVDPTAVCQDVTVQLNAAGTGSTTAAAANNGSSDACGIESLSLSQTTFGCAEIGANAETLTVTDVNGNSSTCAVTVTVEDNVAPTALCQDVTVQLNAAGTGSTTAAAVNNGSSDACGIASLSLSQTAFDCEDIGANPETLTVTDVNGNSATCSVTVTVEDNVDPTADCLDVTVQLDANGNGTLTVAEVNNGALDGCGIDELSLSQTSFDCEDTGLNTVTLTVIDVNGNVSTCSATVTVEDNVDPTALCQDVTVQLNAAGTGSTTAAAVNNGSSDACGIESLSLSQTTFNCEDIGANPEILTVTDVNGNTSTCSATVTVEDNIDPTALCQGITVTLDEANLAIISTEDIDNGSSDACGILSVALDQTSFDCTDIGETTVVLTVTDVNGNSATCSATVTVNEGITPCCSGPQALCKDIDVLLDTDGTATIEAAAIDNGSVVECGLESMEIDISSFDCTDIGAPVTVTLTITDNNEGSSTCQSTVTVLDEAGPSALCQNVTVFLDADGGGTTTASAVDNNSTDACGLASLSLNQTKFDCVDVGTVIVTLTAMDLNGNTSTCQAAVTVVDNIDPEVDCSDIEVALNGEGSIPLDSEALVSATDNCGIANIETDLVAVNCGSLGQVIPVTVTVSDPSGNTASCTANVTVGGMPCGWMEMPDGIGCTNGSNGSYDAPTETFNLVASGCYTPSATSDESGFIKYLLCGDGSITAHIAGLTLPGFAGIVMRESDAPGSKKVAMAYQGANALARYVRYTTNGASFPSYINTAGSRWLRIVRTGNIFRGYHSVNGVNWIYAFAVTVPMNSCLQVGLIAWGTNPNSVVTASFDHVVINPPYSNGPLRPATGNDTPVELEAEIPALELWPNPTNGISTLNLDATWGKEVSVEVMDEFGRQVVSFKADATIDPLINLDLSDKPQGLYLIRVKSDRGLNAIRKLVISR